jgi:uncharacterized protein (DUF427 family)
MTKGHTITIRPSDHRVEVALGEVTIAASDRAVVLHETGLPPRYYLPRDDVRMDLLVGSDSRTTCPFKGEASYWSVELDDRTYADLVWAYEAPIPAAAEIAGLVCFYNERVDLTIGEERVARPETPMATTERCG